MNSLVLDYPLRDVPPKAEQPLVKQLLSLHDVGAVSFDEQAHHYHSWNDGLPICDDVIAENTKMKKPG